MNMKRDFKAQIEREIILSSDFLGVDIMQTKKAIRAKNRPIKEFLGPYKSRLIIDNLASKVCRAYEMPVLNDFQLDITFNSLCERLYNYCMLDDQDSFKKGVMGDFFKRFFRLLKNIASPRKAAKLAVLGPKDSGKSTLWKALGGITEAKPNTLYEPVPSFVMTRVDGTKVRITETHDIGGDDDGMAGLYSLYENLIDEGTFIYYMVPLIEAESKKVSFPKIMTRVRSDLLKISKVVTEKQIKKFGLKFLLTHLYDFKIQNPACDEQMLCLQFLKEIEKSKRKGPVGEKLSNYGKELSDIVMVAELDETKAQILGKNYIEEIKNEIGG